MRTTTKLRIADGLRWGLSLIERCGVRLPSIVERGGVRWSIDWDEAIDFSIAVAGAFDRKVQRACRRRIERGWIVYDIGANRGAISLPLAIMVGSLGRVHAFEPAAEAVAALRRNLQLNPWLESRVLVHHAFLSDGSAAPSSVEASWPLGRWRDFTSPHGGSGLSLGGAEVEQLDDRIDRLGLPDPQLVKLDVDGHEDVVLRGSMRMLERCRPPMVLEVAPDAHDAISTDGFRRLCGTLRDLRYRLVTVGGRRLPLDDRQLRQMTGRGAGFVAVACVEGRQPGGED